MTLAQWRSRAVRLSSPFLLACVLACATSRSVTGPNGATAYDVDCFGGRWSCSEEARRVCEGGNYIVLDEDVTLGMMSRDRQGSLRIQCVADSVAARTPPPDASSGGAGRASEFICRSAYKDVARLATGWGAARGAPPKSAPPTREDFMQTCAALPEEAQLCLNIRYGELHTAACAQSVDRLSDVAKASLDTLFLLRSSKRGRDEAAAPGERL